VKFNWILSDNPDSSVKRACIDLEYRLRPKITKFLLSKFEGDNPIDFSSFHFDVDMKNQWVWISDKTPANHIEKIQVDFDAEINGLELFSVA
jgi:hypothetical protein